MTPSRRGSPACLALPCRASPRRGGARRTASASAGARPSRPCRCTWSRSRRGPSTSPSASRSRRRRSSQAGGFQCSTPAGDPAAHLILFDFGREIHTQFHMNNVPAALDIAFVKGDGRIFSILRMEPSPTSLYGPMGTFRYALEARAGFFESQGIRQGEARLAVPECRPLSGRASRHDATARATSTASGPSLCLTAAFLLVEAGVGVGRAASRSSPTPPTCWSTRAARSSSLLAVWFAERPATPGEDLRLLPRRDPRRPRQRRRALPARPRHPRQGLRAPVASAARGGRARPGGGHRRARREPRSACACSTREPAESLNVRSAYLEVLGDAASSAAVIAAGA